MYPDIRIIVADDSAKPHSITGAEHLLMPYDSGVSAGRNLALSKVDTPYVVTLDDDFIFNDRTQLSKWLEILENNTEIDIVGGQVDGHPQYQSSLHIEDNALIFKPNPRSRLRNFDLWDIVLQFWMGRTEKIRGIGGWSALFKTCDHIPFFCRALGKLNIVYTPGIVTGHMPIRDQNYFNHRNKRMQYHLNMLMDHLNVNRVIDRNGVTIYTRDGHTLR
jgi:glycosyltransferase involved in cell wall biosynthesis